jgi:queuine/archaeosine tRNA-ribosyltransferase
MVKDGRDRDEAVKQAEDAAQALESLKPVDENSDIVVGTVQGGLVYDVLTRSAGYLVESGDRALAKGYIGRMQAWAEAVFGEPFDSLTDHLRELAKE